MGWLLLCELVGAVTAVAEIESVDQHKCVVLLHFASYSCYRLASFCRPPSQKIWSNVKKLTHHLDEGIPPFMGGDYPVTKSPTKPPTNAPSFAPTQTPTYNPTTNPTTQPTIAPTPIITMRGHRQTNFYIAPTQTPTPAPSIRPTAIPTPGPTDTPTASPTKLVCIHKKV